MKEHQARLRVGVKCFKKQENKWMHVYWRLPAVFLHFILQPREIEGQFCGEYDHLKRKYLQILTLSPLTNNLTRSSYIRDSQLGTHGNVWKKFCPKPGGGSAISSSWVERPGMLPSPLQCTIPQQRITQCKMSVVSLLINSVLHEIPETHALHETCPSTQAMLPKVSYSITRAENKNNGQTTEEDF